MDQRFLSFVGIDPKALEKQLAEGKGDGENPGMDTKRTRSTSIQTRRSRPGRLTGPNARPVIWNRASISASYRARQRPKREDITSWFDLLDVDDPVHVWREAIGILVITKSREAPACFRPFPHDLSRAPWRGGYFCDTLYWKGKEGETQAVFQALRPSMR